MSLVWDFQKGISCRGKYVLFGLVWFGGHPNQLQRSPLQCPWSGVFKKVYHVGVNIDYLGCLHWRSYLEVTMISCRGHHDQLQRSPKSAAEVTIALSLVWDFQKGIICRGKYALFGLVWFGGHQNQLQRSPL